MPFIGQQPTTGAFLELDSLTASATANYTLQLNGANYYPESVNNLLVSINGVIQGSSTMSLNGAVLSVGATLSDSDVIDFVRVFGNVGTISTPTDGSVTANKIGTGAITNAKIANDAGIAGSKLGTDAILQVKQGILTTIFEGNTTSTAFEDTPLTVEITPKSTSSKILITGMINFSGKTSQNIAIKVVRNGADFLLSTESMGNRTQCHFEWFFTGNNSYGLIPAHINLLDEPSTTSTLTYRVQVATILAASHQAFLNRMGTDSNTSAYVYTVSTLTAMEIGG